MKNKIKLGVSIALMIVALTGFTKSTFGGIALLLAGLSLYPKVSEKLLKIIPVWKNKLVRIAIPLILFVIGSSVIRFENKDVIALNKNKDVIINYIKQNVKQDKSLSNLKILAETGALFDNRNYFLENPHDGYLKATIDTLTGISTFVANPEFNFEHIRSLRYLKPDTKKGNIISYSIIYEVDKENKITSNKSIIEYSKTGSEEYTNETIPSLEKLINKDIVSSQKDKLAMAEVKRKGMEAYNKRAKKFEDDCLNPWNGSHILFSKMIKEQTNDPDSFKHVNTTYRLFKGYAVVNMTFRGKNKFNATVTNKLSAKISLNNCSVLEIFD
jgi:hypothetical protein